MKRVFTAQEMREMATEAEVIEVADQFFGRDMDTIAAMLRQAADDLERKEKREKKYEYAVPPQKDCRMFNSLDGAKLQAFIDRMNGLSGRIVRREVGEWEEVEDE